MSPSSTQSVPIAAVPSNEFPPSNELGLIAEVLEDHAELNRAVARLRELCVALCGSQAPADPCPASLIEEFEDMLVPQFAAEEVEEFFGSLVTDQPSLLQRVERLQAEHGEIAEAFNQMLEFARTGPPGSELAARLTRLLDRFDTHEHAENALMQEFVLLDECSHRRIVNADSSAS